MNSLRDNRGYNQGFVPSYSLRVRTARRCNAIVQKMAKNSNEQVLEIGCGTGDLTCNLARETGKNILGTDLCVSFIEEAKKNHSLPNLNYKAMNFLSVGDRHRVLGEEKFHYIVGNGILHHMYNNLDEVLEEIKKLLQNGGKIIFWEPNIRNPYCFFIFRFGLLRKLARLEPEEMALNRIEIIKKLERAGFKNIQVSYRDFLLPGTPKFLVRPIIAFGNLMEKTRLFSWLSQSLFIYAERN